MPKCNKSNFNHALYNLNRTRGKSGEKNKKAVDHKISLMKRVEKEGETKWLKNALMKVNAKLKAMGISDTMVQNTISKKAILSK
ncbi:hypothetical protein KBC03_00745 [Patescibacteria group bacterium]|nr:hypothetical protein [Patescibacteria group bacterium]